MDNTQIEQDRADVAREEAELQTAKDKLAADEAAVQAETAPGTLTGDGTASVDAQPGSLPPAADGAVFNGVGISVVDPVVMPAGAAEANDLSTDAGALAAAAAAKAEGFADPSDVVATMNAAVGSDVMKVSEDGTAAVTTADPEAEHAAASAAANVENIAVAQATIEQGATVDTHLSLVAELEQYAENSFSSALADLALRFRAVFAKVL